MLWLKLLVGADGSKLHSNRVKAWAEKTQPAVSLIDGFAEFVTHAGPSDAAASEMKYFRLPFFLFVFFMFLTASPLLTQDHLLWIMTAAVSMWLLAACVRLFVCLYFDGFVFFCFFFYCQCVFVCVRLIMVHR